MPKTELTTLPENNAFAQLADFNLSAAMAEELDGLSITFERIKIPSAGSTVFELPGEDADEPDAVKDFSGVILWHHPLFAYYRNTYTGGSNPPDCGSFDGVTGTGDPGGNCAKCPYNQFGSGSNRSKLCKNRRRIYVLREGEIFPLLLSLPTGSLKEFTRYIKRLLGKGMKSNTVITRFSLKKTVNTGGIAYSQAQLAVDRPLTAEEQAVIGKLSEQIRGYSLRVGYDADETPMGEDIPDNIDPETGEILEPLR